CLRRGRYATRPSAPQARPDSWPSRQQPNRPAAADDVHAGLAGSAMEGGGDVLEELEPACIPGPSGDEAVPGAMNVVAGRRGEAGGFQALLHAGSEVDDPAFGVEGQREPVQRRAAEAHLDRAAQGDDPMMVLAEGGFGQPGRVAEVVLDVDPARDAAHGEVRADKPDVQVAIDVPILGRADRDRLDRDAAGVWGRAARPGG